MYGKDLIADGTLKHYNAAERLAKEKVPEPRSVNDREVDKSYTGVDPEKHSYLTGEEWYALCERQSLQYGPYFQRVYKYAVDRSWCELE